MPTQTSLTLSTRVYTPAGTTGGVSSWRYNDDTIYHGVSLITESVRGPSKEGVNRVVFKMDIPRVQADDSACGCTGNVLDKAICRVEFVIPSGWSKTLRQEFLARFQDLAQSVPFEAAVENLEGSWG